MTTEGRVLTHPALARKRFIELAHVSEPLFALGETSLVIALEQYPGIDIRSYLDQLDAWGERIRRRTDGSRHVERVVEEINRLLFEEEGFHGDVDDYFDPRSAYLNEVLDRHEGLPLTLSILYLELSRRAGLPMQGVSLPGRFLVKVSGPWGEIVIDPYDRGRVLTTRECQRLMDQIFGGAVRLSEHHLRATPNRDVIARLLAHLKSVCLRHHDLEGAVAASDRILILDGFDSYELRDRGVMAMQLHRYQEAIEFLSRYLELSPYAEDQRQIRDRIDYLQAWLEQN